MLHVTAIWTPPNGLSLRRDADSFQLLLETDEGRTAVAEKMKELRCDTGCDLGGFDGRNVDKYCVVSWSIRWSPTTAMRRLVPTCDGILTGIQISARRGDVAAYRIIKNP